MSNMLPFSNIDTVYHGTNLFSAKVILYNGIMLNAQRELTDFGKGFYVTSNLKQAKEWSRVKAKNPQVNPTILVSLNLNKNQYLSHPETKIPALLAYSIDIYRLILLNGLIFPMPNDSSWFQYENAWKSFVQNCRMGVKHNYDFVYGPIGGSHENGTYYQAKPSKKKEQLSLNSAKAIKCLSNLRITTLTSEKKPLKKSTSEDNYNHIRNPVYKNPINHPFLRAIRDQLIHIGQTSCQHANYLVENSWVATQISKQDSVLFHESPAYWAFFILFGDERLWYRKYEKYSMRGQTNL
jgi:hypothetical protein